MYVCQCGSDCAVDPCGYLMYCNTGPGGWNDPDFIYTGGQVS